MAVSKATSEAWRYTLEEVLPKYARQSVEIDYGPLYTGQIKKVIVDNFTVSIIPSLKVYRCEDKEK